MRRWIFRKQLLASGGRNTHVMDNMVVCHIVEEETALPSKEVPVDSCSCSTLEVPFLATIVWQRGIGVVEVSDHNDCIQNLDQDYSRSEL